MNGYSIIANSYRQLVDAGKIEKEIVEKEIKNLDYLATCSREDLDILINRGAFNDYIKAYCQKALEEAKVTDEIKEKVIGQFRWIFDELRASEVMLNAGYRSGKVHD